MATANLLQTSVSGGTQNALSLQGDGVFFPKASTTSRLAHTLTTTDKGFIVYDTTDNNIYFWNGAAWESIPGSGDAGANGSVQYNDNGIVSGATNFVWDKVNGRVGIGTASPSVPLDVLGSGDGELRLRAGSDAALIFSETAANKNWKVKPSGGDLCFQYSATAFNSGYANKMVLNSIGNLVLAGGTAAANGVGVTFPAVQVASSDANCLDDYEEGTFTPTPNSGTFSAASGRYTKVGNMVTIFFDLTVGTGGGSQITNLPFVAAGASTVASGIYTNAQTYAALTTAPVVVIGASGSIMYFRTVGTGVAFSAMTFTAAANLTGSISYFV